MAASKILRRPPGRVLSFAAIGVLVLGLAAALVVMGDHAYGSSHPRQADAKSGAFTFVVHRVETTDVIADPEFPELNVTAEGEFVVVKLEVTNVSDEPRTFDSTFSTLTDGISEYRVDDAAWRYVGASVKTVQPLESVDAAIVFDVPRDVSPAAILLRSDRLEQGAAVGLG